MTGLYYKAPFVGGPNDGTETAGYSSNGELPKDGDVWNVPQVIETRDGHVLRVSNGFAKYVWGRGAWRFEKSLTLEEVGCVPVGKPHRFPSLEPRAHALFGPEDVSTLAGAAMSLILVCKLCLL